MFQTLTVRTGHHTELLDLTDQIQGQVRKAGSRKGSATSLVRTQTNTHRVIPFRIKGLVTAKVNGGVRIQTL